jgi:hypothetical protein
MPREISWKGKLQDNRSGFLTLVLGNLVIAGEGWDDDEPSFAIEGHWVPYIPLCCPTEELRRQRLAGGEEVHGTS